MTGLSPAGSPIRPPRPGRLGLAALLVSIVLPAFQVAGKAPAPQTLCQGDHMDVSPALIDLGGAEYVRMDGLATGYPGGLYPGGASVPPPAHLSDGLARGRAVVPRDAAGDPDPEDGKIALVSFGMSNTSQEFTTFVERVAGEPGVNPQLVLINGAQGGQASWAWVDPNAPTWDEVNARLADAGLTPEQVQIAWMKHARTGGGDFPEKAEDLQRDLEHIAQNLALHYPNLQIAYLSSRTRAYAYWTGLSPEPAAFESGFSVKWLIEAQIAGDEALNFDPEARPVKAPLLVWGPYLWIDGLNPRSDGRVWTQADLVSDCIHPSQSGRDKVADMLWEFFQEDPTAAPWFLTPLAPHMLYLPALSR